MCRCPILRSTLSQTTSSKTPPFRGPLTVVSQMGYCSTVILSTVPSKPLNVRRGQVSIPTKVRRRRALDTQIALQWDTPTSPNGIILFYIITFNGMTVNTTDASLFLNVMGLTPFTNYTITVAAVNGAGRGNESDVVILQTEQGSKWYLTTEYA